VLRLIAFRHAELPFPVQYNPSSVRLFRRGELIATTGERLRVAERDPLPHDSVERPLSVLMAVRPVWKIDQISTDTTSAADAIAVVQTIASGQSIAANTTSSPPLPDSSSFSNSVH
jgi:hypothetical protein